MKLPPNSSYAPLMEKSLTRYKHFQATHQKWFDAPATGRLLEFGCGAGGFMLTALDNGMDAHGVEVDTAREAQFKVLSRQAAPQWADRFTLYPGRLLPYPSRSFDCCYSWFVFEHVPDPQVSLREITRVLKPGGTLILYAEDARNHWDGHAAAPWPAYLPREFASAYLQGLGIPQHGDFVTKYVVYISTPAVCDMLTTLGMEIVYSNAGGGVDPVPNGLYVTNDAEARALGEAMRDSGRASPRENMTVIARKIIP
jgi:ubiquinone/menaquinone biosynthesis C-methylase UbiE